MRTISLKDAVIEVLQDFVSKSKSFSAYDVTTELRTRVNDGLITIDGLGTITHPKGTGTSQFVAHKDVRHLVHSEVDLYVTSYTAELVTPGSGKEPYMLYKFDPTGASATPAPAFSPSPASPVSSAPSTPRPHRPFTADEYGKVRVYIANQHSKGTNPTLKAIQSRMKDVDVTCDQLADFVTAEGFTLVQPPGEPDSARTVEPKGLATFVL